MREVIDSLLAKGWTTSGEVAAAAGVTRQGAYHHLRSLTDAGILSQVGAGRGARYERRAAYARRFPTAGAAEDDVWRDVVATVPKLTTVPPNVRAIMHYALTEMVNNAIEHSGSETFLVVLTNEQGTWTAEVADQGIGVFESIRRAFDLPDHLAALDHLMKGKVTTDPEHHSGQGIFFTSRAVDRFVLEANVLRWTVDNIREDVAVGTSTIQRGTRVSWRIDEASPRVLKEVFDRFSDPETYAFDRSRIRLVDHGGSLVSRSEAKRVAEGLERFREVVLDFSDVQDVGQGFSDELFRVWASAHPDTRVVPVNMSPPIRMMVDRARADVREPEGR